MLNTPSNIHRAKSTRAERAQDGTLLSWTIVEHPPAGFGKKPRRIGMIELDDGTHVLGSILGSDALQIGQRMQPKMQLVQVNDQGLRRYDIAYIPVTPAHDRVETPVFPGYILALSGPSGVGKSTVNKLLAHVATEQVENVPILTTRKAKKGDSGEYKYVTKQEFEALQKQGKIVAVTHIPSRSEERSYGYLSEDIEAIWNDGKLPTVVTEMHLLQDLAMHYGRRSILSFGLLPPGKSKRAKLSTLLHRLRTRGRDSEKSIADRMKNAEDDLRFFDERTDLFDDILINEDLDSVVGVLKKKILRVKEA